MKRILAATALAGACALAGCDNGEPGGWYPVLTCTQRDLKSGLCTDGNYSCPIEGQKLAYFRVGARCFNPKDVAQ